MNTDWKVIKTDDGTFRIVDTINNTIIAKFDTFSPFNNEEVSKIRSYAQMMASSNKLFSSLTELLEMCKRQPDFNDDGDGNMFDRAEAAILEATNIK